MSLPADQIADVVQAYQLKENDTGSTEVQIAVLTAKIVRLTEHFKKHIHDHHSRRGLLRMVSQRRKHLKYMKNKDLQAYTNLIKRLGIRG